MAARTRFCAATITCTCRSSSLALYNGSIFRVTGADPDRQAHAYSELRYARLFQLQGLTTMNMFLADSNAPCAAAE